MIKIKVHKGTNFVIVGVTPQTYKIIERKVIETIANTDEKQALLKETVVTLPLIMETHITEEIVCEAMIESRNLLIKKLHEKK